MSSYVEGLCMRGGVGPSKAIIQAITQDLCCIYDTRVCPYEIIVDKAFLGHIIKTDSRQLCRLQLRKLLMKFIINWLTNPAPVSLLTFMSPAILVAVLFIIVSFKV